MDVSDPMITNVFKREAAFDTVLHDYRVSADRVMVGVNFFLTLICAALASYRETWIELLVIGLPNLLLSAWLARRYPGALITRLFMAVAFMTFTGLIIHQTGGDIEAHFSAFGLIGILLYYRDWRTIVTATVFIYMHHLVLGYAQKLGSAVFVFDAPNFWTLFGVHVAYFLPFIAMMAMLSVWLRREGFESRQVIALAEGIVQGDWSESGNAPLPTDFHQKPLVTAVSAMKHRLLDLLRVMPVAAAVIRIDRDEVLSVNEAWIQIIGPMPAAKMRFADSPIWTDSTAWPKLIEQLKMSSDHTVTNVEMTIIKNDDQPIQCELSLILHDDTLPVIAILTADDVTARRQAEQELHQLAYRDSLTNLPNRQSLIPVLAESHRAWEMDNVPYALVMLDLDGFKPVNDELGHDAGDLVLKVIGARLRRNTRDTDMAARLGGDEFVLILRQCPTAESAIKAANHTIETIASPIHLGMYRPDVTIGCSAGIAHVTQGTESADELLKLADLALYDAKAAGKNRSSLYCPERRQPVASSDCPVADSPLIQK